MLTDHHCHLQDKTILPHLNHVLKNATQKGITKFICCGTSEEDWQAILDLSKNHTQILPAIGIHPWFVEKVSTKWNAQLQNFLKKNPTCLIGEIGLDLHFCKETINKQKVIFSEQLEIAKAFHRPVSVHNLKAWHLVLPVIEKYTEINIMLHSFSASTEITEKLAKHPNIYFSLSGSILNPSQKMEKVISRLPLDKILLETDSPFLLQKIDKITNHEYNEPANLIFSLEKLAKIRKLDSEFLKQQLAKNSNRFLFQSVV
jgi:TatD DNase family protein